MEYSRLKRSILGVYLVLSEPFPGARRRCALAQGRAHGWQGRMEWPRRPVGDRHRGGSRVQAYPAGAGGGRSWQLYYHAATSFATFTGNQSLMESWYWWYVLRPLIGMTLSVIFYFAVRGGFLLLARSAEDITISPFGVGALFRARGNVFQAGNRQAARGIRQPVQDRLRERGRGEKREACEQARAGDHAACRTGPFFFSFGKVNRRTSSPSGSCTI